MAVAETASVAPSFDAIDPLCLLCASFCNCFAGELSSSSSSSLSSKYSVSSIVYACFGGVGGKCIPAVKAAGTWSFRGGTVLLAVILPLVLFPDTMSRKVIAMDRAVDSRTKLGRETRRLVWRKG